MKLYSPGRRLSWIITSKHFEKIRYKRLVCSELQDFKLVAIDNMLAACMYYKQFAYLCLIVRLSFSVTEATYSWSWAYLQQMCPLRLLLYFVVTQKKKKKTRFFQERNFERFNNSWLFSSCFSTAILSTFKINLFLIWKLFDLWRV